MAEDECNEERIVELARDRDEVRNEIERQRGVGAEPDEQRLVASWHTLVAQKPCDEDDAVGDEGRKSAGVSAAARGVEPEDECRPEHEQDGAGNEQPRPPAHGPQRSCPRTTKPRRGGASLTPLTTC